MRNAKQPNGFVFYHGPSMLTGKPIIGIATGLKQSASNKKTGAMVQIYILSTETNPIEAHKQGLDVSICGDCKHRSANTCYVRLEHGPLVVFKAWQRGNYPSVSLKEAGELLNGRMVRLGAYGDPAAIPFTAWESILAGAADWTGYTHQWKQPHVSPLKRFTMASCDTPEEYHEARRAGWRAFYVVPKNHTDVPQGSFLCPASEEAGKKLTCIDCRACNGIGGKARASVFIPVHGTAHKQAAFNSLIQIGRAV